MLGSPRLIVRRRAMGKGPARDLVHYCQLWKGQPEWSWKMPYYGVAGNRTYAYSGSKQPRIGHSLVRPSELVGEGWFDVSKQPGFVLYIVEWIGTYRLVQLMEIHCRVIWRVNFLVLCSEVILNRCFPKAILTEALRRIKGLVLFFNQIDFLQRLAFDITLAWKQLVVLALLSLGKFQLPQQFYT